MQGPVYTVSEAATQLGVHPDTILRAIRAGALRAHRLGKRGWFRVAEADLLDYARPADEPPAGSTGAR